MTALKLVILDCDGVMFDSRDTNIRYYNDKLAYFGLPEMDAEEREFVHMHDDISAMRHIFRKYPEISAEALARLDEASDYTPYLAGMVMAPGLPGFLRDVQAHGFTAISTNRADSMDSVLATFGLTSLFDFVMTAGRSAHPKPAPDSMERILAHFGIKADAALYIGDSLVDEEYARATGVPFVAFGNPALTANYHVANFAEVRMLPPIASLLSGPVRE